MSDFIKTETQETREMPPPVQELLLVLELCDEGSLSDFLVKHLKAGFAVVGAGQTAKVLGKPWKTMEHFGKWTRMKMW